MRHVILIIAVAFLLAGIGSEPPRGNPGDVSLRLISLLAIHEKRRRNPNVSVTSLMAEQSRPHRGPGKSYRYAF